MKKLLLLTLLFSLPVFAGEDWQKFPIGPFGTLNNRDSSYAISATQAQDLLNVELTPSGKSVKKRKGFGVTWTLNQTTSPVHGVYDFFDSNGNEVNLYFSDTKIYGSVSGASPTVLLSTGSNGATYQCTDSLGQAYCTNSSRTTLYKISGSTLTQIQNVTSTGTMVATAVTRLAMAGFSDAPSRIDFSADTDFTTWGTGSVGTSPAQFTVNAPGARITHIVYAFNRLMWFKDTSFGYILIGNQAAQSDWVIKTVAFDVGTNDNTSIYREGILYFRGQDGNIYAFDGYSYQRISKEIAATINLAQTKTSGAFTVTTQSDFNAGSSTNSVYADTTTTSGTLGLVFPDLFSTYRDGSGNTQAIWKTLISSSSSGCCQSNANLSISTNTLKFYSGNSAGDARDTISARTGLLDNFTQGTTFNFTIKAIDPSGAASSNLFFVVTFSSMTPNPTLPGISTAPFSLNSHFDFTFFYSGSKVQMLQITDDKSDSFSVSGSSIELPANIDIYMATSTYQISIGTKSYSSGTHTWASNKIYAYLGVRGGSSRYDSWYVDNFGIAPATMSFASSVKNAASLTTWDSFLANSVTNGGAHNYYIRGATTSFTAASTSTWTSITSGNIPSISTANFFQIRDDLSITTWTSTPQLYDLTQNWFEGSASDKSYATYFDDKLWWSLTIGTGATTNNRILVYDLLNQGWLLHDIPSNGFYVKQNRLYFGGASSGYIFKYGDIDNDNGAAINSYWKSKDFFGGDLFTSQELANISVSAKEVTNSSMTVTYTTNGSSITSFTMPLTSSKSFLSLNKNLPAGTIGDSYSIKVGNNAADQTWEVFGIQVGIRPKSWIPGGP